MQPQTSHPTLQYNNTHHALNTAPLPCATPHSLQECSRGWDCAPTSSTTANASYWYSLQQPTACIQATIGTAESTWTSDIHTKGNRQAWSAVFITIAPHTSHSSNVQHCATYNPATSETRTNISQANIHTTYGALSITITLTIIRSTTTRGTITKDTHPCETKYRPLSRQTV
jgi:hypothetical protein